MIITIDKGRAHVYAGPRVLSSARHFARRNAIEIVLWWAHREGLLRAIGHHLQQTEEQLAGRVRRLKLEARREQLRFDRYADYIDRGEAKICQGRIVCRLEFPRPGRKPAQVQA